MDFEDAEGALRLGLANFRGWTFSRFQSMKAQEQHLAVPGSTGARYVLEADVTDRSGDYDSKDEWLELEFSIYGEQGRRIWAPRPYVRAITALRAGQVFSGDPGDIVRGNGWGELGCLLLLAGLAAAATAAAAYRVFS